jgi:hypothetical protein
VVGVTTHAFLLFSIYALAHNLMDSHGINVLQILNGLACAVFVGALPGKGDGWKAKPLGPGDRVATHHRTRREIIADLLKEDSESQPAVGDKKTR